MQKPINISIIGAGNVATHLAKQFINHPQIHLQQMYNRNINKLKEFENDTEIINDLKLLKPADIIIVSITDDAIGDFSQKLQHLDSLIVHTSGSTAMEALQINRKGVFYPFQTFSKSVDTMNFAQIPILIEAKFTKDLALLKKLGKLLSNNVQEVHSKQRLALHIAGVFAANFVNRMYVEADIILQENQLSFDLLKPLILEVAQKVQTIPPIQAQTGPAIRGDQKVIEKHLNFLKNNQQNKIYELLSNIIKK